ncbi:unnamed protein product [Schistosoma turkestanicum]|nr:unnamed protein product [Schistosoma turkestanicum]
MKDTQGFRSSSRLKQQIESLNAYVPTSESLKRFQRILLDDLQDQVNTQQRLEDSAQEAVGTIQSQDTDADKIQQAVDEVVRVERTEQEQLLSDKETIIQQLENQLREFRQLEQLRAQVMRTVFDALPESQFNANRALGTPNDIHTTNSEFADGSVESSHLKNTLTSETGPCEDLNENDEILDRVRFLVDDYKRLQHEVEGNISAEEKITPRNEEFQKELDQFIDVYAEAQQNMKDTQGFRSSSRLKQQIESLNAYVPTSESLKRFQRILLDDLQDQVNTQQRLEDSAQEAVGTIQSQDTDISTLNDQYDLISIIRRLAEIATTTIQQKCDLLEQFKSNEMEHEEEILKIKSLIQNEWKVQMDDKMAKLNYENADKIQRAVEEVARAERMRQEQLLSDKEAIIEQLENQLRETRQILTEKQIAHETKLNEVKEANKLLSRLQHEIELNGNQIRLMKSRLNQQNQANLKLLEETEKQCESRWKSDVDSNREQVRQQARTICVLRERLIKLTKQLNDTKNEVAKLKRTNSDLLFECKQLQVTNKPPLGSSYTEDNTSPKFVDKLKHEILKLKLIIKEQTSTIEVLRSCLEGKLVHACDLTDAQKEDIESALNYGKKTNLELFNTKTQLVNLKNSYRHVTRKLQEREDEIRKLKITNKVLNNPPYSEYELKIKLLHETPNDERKELRNPLDVLRVSEECYLSLVQSISNSLEMLDHIPDQKSLIKLSSMERDLVVKDRLKTMDILSHRIEILKDQLQHKEDLLVGYERDFSILKQIVRLNPAILQAALDRYDRFKWNNQKQQQSRSKSVKFSNLREKIGLIQSTMNNVIDDKPINVSSLLRLHHNNCTPWDTSCSEGEVLSDSEEDHHHNLTDNPEHINSVVLTNLLHTTSVYKSSNDNRKSHSHQHVSTTMVACRQQYASRHGSEHRVMLLAYQQDELN